VRRTLFIVAVLVGTALAQGQKKDHELSAEKRSQIEAAVSKFMASTHVPGVSIGVVENGEFEWAAGFGFADNGSAFRRGRDFAAWVGVVPRRYSTGGKQKLYGISKRGNVYLRRMLIHGARSVLFRVKYDTGGFGQWVHRLAHHRGGTQEIVPGPFPSYMQPER